MNDALNNTTNETAWTIADIELQNRTEQLWAEMDELGRDRCAHLFIDDESEEG